MGVWLGGCEGVWCVVCSVSPIPVHAVNDYSGSLSLVGIEPAGAEYNVL